MTREDTIKVLAILKAAYPASYRNMTRDEANGVVMIWATQFANISVEAVMIAVQQHISSNTFPPSVSEIKSKLRSMYWQANMMIEQHKNGVAPLDEEKLKTVKAIEQSCDSLRIKTETTLEELIGGVQKYITDGKAGGAVK